MAGDDPHGAYVRRAVLDFDGASPVMYFTQ
jgi:hypothetical protein